ncbi:MAG: sulfatase [Phycisphaerae bacterium]|nr:sulfatase [Phycisphaerae bacterium]
METSRRRFLQNCGLAMLAFGAGKECCAKEKAGNPNILMIVSEDNGPELSCYGEPYVKTPVLDKLAANGVRFENAFVPYSVCSPSRGCFLTGQWPQQNGQIGLATHNFAFFNPEVPHMSTLLKKQGYRTAMLGKLHVNPEDAFKWDYRKIPGANFNRANMQDYSKYAAEFFSQGDEPFFLSINYPDAHYPLHRNKFKDGYGWPAKPLEAKDVKPLKWIGADSEHLRDYTAQYYNCMNRLDTLVGDLLIELEKSGKADNTMIIYFGDHGAQFSRGKCSVYEASLRVPLIVSWPGMTKKGYVARELVSTLDLLPTMMMASGGAQSKSFAGKPLQPLLAGKADKDFNEYFYGFTTGASPNLMTVQYSVRDIRYKLICTPQNNKFPTVLSEAYANRLNAHFAGGTSKEEIDASGDKAKEIYNVYAYPPKYELYDLRNDPCEFDNLADNKKYAEVKVKLIKALAAHQEKIDDQTRHPEKLQAYLDEQAKYYEIMKAGKSSPHRKRGFRWGYLDYLDPKK